MALDSQVIDLDLENKPAIEVIIPQTPQKTSTLKSAFNFVFSCLLKPERKIYNDYSKVEEDAKLQNKVLIIYRDGVYDVTGYLDAHPGGRQILLMANSKIVDKVFNKYHYPQGNAPIRMKKMKIGEVRFDQGSETTNQLDK